MGKKPQPQKPKTAHELINDFINQNDIVLGLSRPELSYNKANDLIVSQPKIIALFKSEVKANV